MTRKLLAALQKVVASKIINLQSLGHGDIDILSSLLKLEEEMGLEISGQVPLFGMIDGVHVAAAIWVEPEGGFFTVAVDPKYQSKGYARKLLEKLIKYGKEQGWEFLCCDAIHPATKHLAQDLGFVHRGNIEWYLSLEE
jgi:GNAT superfamily N-acetyltransferase